MQTKVNFQKFLTFLGDIGILYLSLWLALLLRYYEIPSSIRWDNHFTPFTIIFALWILIFYIADFYNPALLHKKIKILQTVVKFQLINASISILFFYIFPIFDITPKTNLILTIIISTILLYSWRLITRKIVDRSWFVERIAFIGSTTETEELLVSLKKNQYWGYEIAAIFTNKKLNIKLKIPIYNLRQLNSIIVKENIDIVVTSLTNPKQSNHLFRHIFRGLKFYDLTSFYENLTGKIPLSIVEQSWFLQNISVQIKRPYNAVKRTIDVAMGLITGLISLIFYPFIILAIKLTDKGPIFYKQIRVGQNNKIIELVKFRTMKPNAEKDGLRFAKKNDSRITKVGKWLRKTRLDELPQLWSVLKGDLSLVGPRPERPEFVSQFEEKIPYYSVRHLVKPGLTGWAQINYEYYASLEEMYKKLQYDIYYIKNSSPILDLAIALKTIKTVLTSAGR